MTNWAWVIGINNYHRLQPLRGAIRDAELMRDFCLESNFEQIFYYSDNSPDFIALNGSRQPTQPSYGNLRAFLRDFFDTPQLQAGDNFWFFFSGHGVRHQGRDYLMPTDAHPEDIEYTALYLNYIIERLRRSGADNIILLLDACRNEDKGGLGIGVEKYQGVITISSCSPSEKSYEIQLTDEISQGSFTTALLEGMSIRGEGNCATVERLYQHLTYRVPQINQKYGKPDQFPYLMAEPPSKQHYILLPQNATLRDADPLRKEALKAEVKEDYQLARQLWIRVLEVSPRDYEAIEGIERIACKMLTQPQKVEIPSTPPSEAKETSVKSSKSIPKEADQNKSDEVELKSEKGVNYTQLRDFLKQGKWKEADKETAKLMCQVANRTSQRFLTGKDIDNFPCEDLRTINQLWLHYSNGKFGFSVQAEIYRSLGGTREYHENIWDQFCERIGWRKGGEWLSYYQLTFELLNNTPVGHLPGGAYNSFLVSAILFGEISSLASRLVTCRI